MTGRKQDLKGNLAIWNVKLRAVHATVIKYMRKTLEVSRMKKVRNEHIIEVLQIKPILQFVENDN